MVFEKHPAERRDLIEEDADEAADEPVTIDYNTSTGDLGLHPAAGRKLGSGRLVWMLGSDGPIQRPAVPGTPYFTDPTTAWSAWRRLHNDD